eukprot:Opistho-2@30576
MLLPAAPAFAFASVSNFRLDDGVTVGVALSAAVTGRSRTSTGAGARASTVKVSISVCPSLPLPAGCVSSPSPSLVDDATLPFLVRRGIGFEAASFFAVTPESVFVSIACGSATFTTVSVVAMAPVFLSVVGSSAKMSLVEMFVGGATTASVVATPDFFFGRTARLLAGMLSSSPSPSNNDESVAGKSFRLGALSFAAALGTSLGSHSFDATVDCSPSVTVGADEDLGLSAVGMATDAPLWIFVGSLGEPEDSFVFPLDAGVSLRAELTISSHTFPAERSARGDTAPTADRRPYVRDELTTRARVSPVFTGVTLTSSPPAGDISPPSAVALSVEMSASRTGESGTNAFFPPPTTALRALRSSSTVDLSKHMPASVVTAVCVSPYDIAGSAGAPGGEYGNWVSGQRTTTGAVSLGLMLMGRFLDRDSIASAVSGSIDLTRRFACPRDSVSG